MSVVMSSIDSRNAKKALDGKIFGGRSMEIDYSMGRATKVRQRQRHTDRHTDRQTDTSIHWYYIHTHSSLTHHRSSSLFLSVQ